MGLIGSISNFFHGRGLKSSAEDEEESGEGGTSTHHDKKDGVDMLIERWTMACFGAHIMPARQNLSVVFAPLPSLALFSLLYLTVAEASRDKMRGLCAISERSIRSLQPRIHSIMVAIDGSKHVSLLFRALLREAQMRDVNDKFLGMAQAIFGRRIIVSVDISDISKYVAEQSYYILPHTVVPAKSGLIGVATGGLRAAWKGKTSQYGPRPFATSVADRQMHEFFVLDAPARSIEKDDWEAWWLDVSTSSDAAQAVALVFIRPLSRAGILPLREELTGAALRKMLHSLKDTIALEARMLLPAVQLHSESELLGKWRLSGIFAEALRSSSSSSSNSSSAPIAPPFVSIAGGATLAFDQKGLRTQLQPEKPHPALRRSDARKTAFDRSSNPNFHFRLDTPFLVFAVHVPTLLPLLAACYAGSPASSSLAHRRRRTVSIQSASERRKEKKHKKKNASKSGTDIEAHHNPSAVTKAARRLSHSVSTGIGHLKSRSKSSMDRLRARFRRSKEEKTRAKQIKKEKKEQRKAEKEEKNKSKESTSSEEMP